MTKFILFTYHLSVFTSWITCTYSTLVECDVSLILYSIILVMKRRIRTCSLLPCVIVSKVCVCVWARAWALLSHFLYMVYMVWEHGALWESTRAREVGGQGLQFPLLKWLYINPTTTRKNHTNFNNSLGTYIVKCISLCYFTKILNSFFGVMFSIRVIMVFVGVLKVHLILYF